MAENEKLDFGASLCSEFKNLSDVKSKNGESCFSKTIHIIFIFFSRLEPNIPLVKIASWSRIPGSKSSVQMTCLLNPVEPYLKVMQ